MIYCSDEKVIDSPSEKLIYLNKTPSGLSHQNKGRPVIRVRFRSSRSIFNLANLNASCLPFPARKTSIKFQHEFLGGQIIDSPERRDNRPATNQKENPGRPITPSILSTRPLSLSQADRTINSALNRSWYISLIVKKPSSWLSLRRARIREDLSGNVRRPIHGRLVDNPVPGVRSRALN